MSIRYVDRRPDTGLSPRLLTYISERFPLPSYGVAILVFFLCSYLTAKAMSSSLWVLNAEVIIGFVTTLLIFFRIRIMDEIKDAGEDALYHPERPVPRGLITLRELRIAAISIAFIEIGLNLSLGITTFLVYLIVLAFTLLMYKEFFAGEWLKRKPLLYSASHLMIMPLLALYIYAVQSLNQSGFITAFLYYLD